MAAPAAFQVGDRVMVSGLDDELRAGTVTGFETFESHPHEATMWVRLDTPYDHRGVCLVLGHVWVSGDHTTVTGPVSLGARCEPIQATPAPVLTDDADCPIFGDLTTGRTA